MLLKLYLHGPVILLVPLSVLKYIHSTISVYFRLFCCFY